jgi:hypothetical protein
VSDSTVPELDAFPANEREPERVPLLWGVNATRNETLPPAGIVNGKEAPFKTNWELLLLTEDTVTLVPAALMVIGRVCVVPSATSPKFSDAGAMVNWLEAVVVPVPVRGMAAIAGPETSKLPPVMPADFGEKVTFSVTLCPAPRIKGNVAPLIENSLPVV